MIPKEVSSLREHVQEQGIRPLNLANLAGEVGLGSYYDSLYRLLSPSVHFRVRSLEDYLKLDEEGDITKVEWGPQYKDVPLVLGTAMDILLRSWGAINDLLQLDLTADIRAYLERLKHLQSQDAGGG